METKKLQHYMQNAKKRHTIIGMTPKRIFVYVMSR